MDGARRRAANAHYASACLENGSSLWRPSSVRDERRYRAANGGTNGDIFRQAAHATIPYKRRMARLA
jgi:hypothetical protein